MPLLQIMFAIITTVSFIWCSDNLCRIKEHTTINTVVCSINHLLVGEKQNLYLSSHKDIFKINSLNQIVVLGNIDREVLDIGNCVPGPDDSDPPYCRLTVELINKSKPQDFQVIPISVDIEDINDNYPIFEKHAFTIDIDENLASGHLEHLPVARDQDSGVNGKVTYSLEGRDKLLFDLIQSDKDRPMIKTLRMFDRETKDKYEMILIGSDRGDPKRTSEVKLIVRIRDVNDNTPEFNFQKDTVIGVKEDTTEGSKIGNVKVFDKDVDSVVSVFLDPSVDSDVKTYFQVSGNTGLTLSRTLNYESPLKKFIIPLIAVDNGTPKLTASVTLIVNVLDVNDNSPIIIVDSLSEQTNNFKVTENRPKESLVAMVTVRDDDSGPGGIVDCSLSEHSSKQHFDLLVKQYSSIAKNKRNYRLVTLQEFDREKSTHYSLTINCKDQGEPSLSTQQVITVWIEDENDNPPTFLRSHYRGSVKENSLPGTKLFELQAIDADVGVNSQTRYSIHPKYQDLVAINNPSTGIVTNLVVFDREVHKSIKFLAFAVDMKNPSLNSSVDVTIEIEDENDCSPVFERTAYFFRVKEGHSGWIGKVQAYDNDSDSNGRISFVLTAFTKSNLWVVRSDGNLFSERGQLLDRETQNLYHLTVETHDHGSPSRTSSVMVQIQIDDINDNAPRFIQPMDTRDPITISETMIPGSLITKVTAVDDDELENGRVTYHIFNSDFFAIDETNGEIYINRTLTRSNNFKRRLIVIAKDCGRPAMSSTLYLSVLFQPETDDRTNNAANFHQNSDRRNPEQKGGNIEENNLLRWNSKEVLITMTVGSVFLILCCAGFLLLYMWHQSRPQIEVEKSDEIEGTMTDLAIDVTNRKTETASCIQWFCCLSRGNRPGKTVVASATNLPRQKQKHRDISQPLCDEKMEQMHRGSNNPLELESYMNSNSPLMFRYQQQMFDLKHSTDSLDSTSTNKQTANFSNIYEPPLKAQQLKYSQNYSTIQLPPYNTTNQSMLVYNTTNFQSSFPVNDNQSLNNPRNNYGVSSFAIPNPRINNSFV